MLYLLNKFNKKENQIRTIILKIKISKIYQMIASKLFIILYNLKKILIRLDKIEGIQLAFLNLKLIRNNNSWLT